MLQVQSSNFAIILETIKTHAKTTFPDIFEKITDAQWAQIAWIDDTHATSEKAAEYQRDGKLSIHVKRVLARLNCLNLLRDGSEDSYKKFVAAQAAQTAPVLQYENFVQLSIFIQSLDPNEYQALWVATTTAMSPTANEAATNLFKKIGSVPQFGIDAVKFLADVMTTAPETYPASLEFFRKVDQQTIGMNYFDAMFNTAQLRHLMYQEGNLRMLEGMGKKLANGKFSAADFKLWFAYWLIDVAGFRGHIDERGSQYLNNNTFTALWALKTALESFVASKNAGDAIRKYLTSRAILLGFLQKNNSSIFQSLSNQELVLTKIACMVRLFTPEEGGILKTALNKLEATLSPEDRTKLVQSLNPLGTSSYPTPTFLPALFQNLLDCRKYLGGEGSTDQNLKCEAIKKGLEIYLSLLKRYEPMFAEGRVNNQPLNFNSIAKTIVEAKGSLKLVIDHILDNATIDPKTGEAKAPPFVLVNIASTTQALSPLVPPR